MRILVTGGAGFVGRATVRALVEAGHAVRIVSRDAWPSGSLFERLGVEVVTGDAAQRPVTDAALDGIDALVQGAATYRYDLADTIRWWAEHDSIDRRFAGGLAPKAI
jgi:uncharacterized protein YbjT (DUF2867 family)